MCELKTVPLGFTEEEVPVGTHMCLVFTKEEERVSSLLKFLLSGMQNNERAACFSEQIAEDDIRNYFKANNISFDEFKENKAISLSGTHEVYFKGGVFDPDQMLGLLKGFYNESHELGFHASRVIGEMSTEIERVILT
jgi:hypothetical protein